MTIHDLVGRTLKKFEYKEGLLKDRLEFSLYNALDETEECVLRYPRICPSGKIDVFGHLTDIIDMPIREVRETGNDFGGIDYRITTAYGSVMFRFYQVAVFERME